MFGTTGIKETGLGLATSLKTEVQDIVDLDRTLHSEALSYGGASSLWSSPATSTEHASITGMIEAARDALNAFGPGDVANLGTPTGEGGGDV